jgi:predicted PurR-regulated permease PerM
MRNALLFVAAVAAGFAIQYFRGIITPLVIAVFLLLLIDGFSRTLARRFPNWPDWLRSSMGAVLTIAGFALIVLVCVQNARSFASQIIVIEPRIDALLGQLSALLQAPPLTMGDLFRRGDPATALTHALGAVRGVVFGAVLVMIYLGFLIASQQAFGRKARLLFATAEARTHAERVFSRVRSASEQYIGLQTLKATLIAAVAWAIMTFLGLSNAEFLAFILFLGSYIPIVGGFVAAIVPSLIALAQFGGVVQAAVLFVGLGGSIFLVDNVLMPKLQSDRLNLDPVFVLLSLGFWGGLLGIPGALLSTPLTVVVMTLAFEFPGARWLAILLSKDGEPAIHDEP